MKKLSFLSCAIFFLIGTASYAQVDTPKQDRVMEHVEQKTIGDSTVIIIRKKKIVTQGEQMPRQIEVEITERMKEAEAHLKGLEKRIELETEKRMAEADKILKDLEGMLEKDLDITFENRSDSTRIIIRKKIDGVDGEAFSWEDQEGKNIRIEEIETDSDTTEVDLKKRKIVIIHEGEGKPRVQIEKKEEGDRRIEEKEITIEEDHEDAFGREDDEDDEDDEDEDDKKRKKAKVELLGLDIGLNNFIHPDNFQPQELRENLELQTFNSRHVAIHLLPTTLPFDRQGYVNLRTALTFDFNNLRLANDQIIQRDQEVVTFLAADAPLKRNKLRATYIQLPLLLHFNTNPSRSKRAIKIALGGFGGLLIDGKTKVVYEEGGTKEKAHNRFNMNPLRYGLTARVDFRWFDFYFNYNLSPFFKEQEGPATNLFSAGINILDF